MRKSVLLVGGSFALRTDGLLARCNLHVERVQSCAEALATLVDSRFDVVAIAHSQAESRLDELLSLLRESTSASRHARVILHVRRDSGEDLDRRRDPSVRFVIGDAPEVLERAIAESLDVAPRAAERVNVRLRVRALVGPLSALCRTVNLSQTGMLVETRGRYAPGAKIDFELDLPGQSDPCSGMAEVVRIVELKRDDSLGFAMRFLAFRGEGRTRLNAALAQRISTATYAHSRTPVMVAAQRRPGTIEARPRRLQGPQDDTTSSGSRRDSVFCLEGDRSCDA